jgi:hypothetical protein
VYIKCSSRWLLLFFERLYLEKMVSLYFWLSMPMHSKTSLSLTTYMFIDFLRPLTFMAWPWWRGSANVGVCAFQSAFSSSAAVHLHLLAITMSCSIVFWLNCPSNKCFTSVLHQLAFAYSWFCFSKVFWHLLFYLWFWKDSYAEMNSVMWAKHIFLLSNSLGQSPSSESDNLWTG